MQPNHTALVLGTAHLENVDNGDLHIIRTEGIFTERRQEEIQSVVENLVQFKPTKVVVEWPKELNHELNQEYKAYLNNDLELAGNEVHQIGFRLAKEAGLPEVFAVDWNEDLPGMPDFEQWAEANGSTVFKEVNAKMSVMAAEIESSFSSQSFSDFLKELNSQKKIRENQELYMKLALLGTDQEPVGAEWTAQYWYYRNLLIYKNIVELLESEEEQVFLLYGAGHLHILRQFLNESGLFHLDSVADFL